MYLKFKLVTPIINQNLNVVMPLPSVLLPKDNFLLYIPFNLLYKATIILFADLLLAMCSENARTALKRDPPN